MKYLKHLLLLTLLMVCAAPMGAQEEKPKVDVKSITWYGLPDGKTEADYAGNVSSFGSSKLGTGSDKQVDTNLPSISSGLNGSHTNRYLMPLGSSTISSSNGMLHNSYGYND